jgi:hypothetical protein
VPYLPFAEIDAFATIRSVRIALPTRPNRFEGANASARTMDAPAATSGTPSAHAFGPRTVLMIVGASILCGVGLLGMAYWLVFLPFHWIYFLSLVPLVGGAYLLFTRATGPDHA